MKFTRENQGANTYLVYQIEATDQIDTLGLGMLINNKIRGIAPVIYNQLDSQKFLKYNISAKVSLGQYFMGTVNRQRLLGVFYSILEGMTEAEDYMIDLSALLLNPDYIFVDVSTAEAILICVPVIEWREKNIDIGKFFKAIMFNTQFDQEENGDYIAKIIGYLNSTEGLFLKDFQQLIKSLLDEDGNGSSITPNLTQLLKEDTIKSSLSGMQEGRTMNSAQLQTAYQPMQKLSPEEQKMRPVQNPSAIAPSVEQPSLKQQYSVSLQEKETSEKNIPDMGFAIPGGAAASGELKRKKEKEKKSKEKKVKEKKSFSFFGKKKKEESIIEVPGMEGESVKMQGTFVTKDQTLENSVSDIQPVNPPKNAPVAPPPASARNTSSVEGRYADVHINTTGFGETTVLGDGRAGQTVVLSSYVQSGKPNPHLIRVRSKERIAINKPVFRIGKERSYVDYFIGDNPAISRSHANIITKEDGYYIEDTNSTNHTYVNEQIIVSGNPVKLERNTKIRLGNEEFVFNY